MFCFSEVLEAARQNDQRAVALAVFVCRNHKQLNTMNANRETLLHMACISCPVALVRLIITRGADGAIADAWGKWLHDSFCRVNIELIDLISLFRFFSFQEILRYI